MAKKKKKSRRWDGIAKYINSLPKTGKEIIGAEVGVHRGELSHKLFKLIPRLKLYMIDIWSEEAYPEQDATSASEKGQKKYKFQWQDNMNAAKKAVKGRKAKVIRSDSLSAVEKFPDSHFTFVFIDADHSYKAVKEDISIWLPKVRKGGYICGHDYELTERRKFGVRDAVDEAFGDKVQTGAGGTWFVKV
jgi:hypothetical protein